MGAGYRFAFRRYSHFTVDSRGVPYDFQSVMHYGMKTFSRNGGLTIVPRDAAVKRLGGSRLSRLDVKQANLMYGCTAGTVGEGEGGSGSVEAVPGLLLK